ncbi:MAG: hypothetical protein ABI358_14545 [Ginsengibacter sp.]
MQGIFAVDDIMQMQDIDLSKKMMCQVLFPYIGNLDRTITNFIA